MLPELSRWRSGQQSWGAGGQHQSNARRWTLKMLNDGLGWQAKGVLPSCTTSPGVYARGFVGGTGSDGRLPGPSNRTILLANMGNGTATAVVQDAAGGSSPLWMVANKRAGYDAVPYARLTVPKGGAVLLPPFAVALVFVADAAGCGSCNATNTAHNHSSMPLSPSSGADSAEMNFLDPTDWAEFQGGLGPTCSATTPANCPQFNPPCDCDTPHCTEFCSSPGHERCCGRNVSSLWTGPPHIQTMATAARTVQGTGSLTHIVAFRMAFKYISGSYPGAAQGANFSVRLVKPGAGTRGDELACKVDTPPRAPPASLAPAVATLWRSPHYDDYRYCEASSPPVKGPLSCPVFPADLQYYSPTVRVNVTLTTPVENLQPLQLQLAFDNNDRCLLLDLDSLRVELVWASPKTAGRG